MKAYQYFHLPTGYLAKLSEENPAELALLETLRQSAPGANYLAYYVIGEMGYVLSSALDESRNQLVRGRIAALSELKSLPVSYCERIPDTRLLRADMPLFVRPFMVSADSFRCCRLDNLCMARAFEAILDQKDAVLAFENQEDALSALHTLLGLLPLELAKRVSFYLGEEIPPFKQEVVDASSTKVEVACHLVLLRRPLRENEKTAYPCIDFTYPNQTLEHLSPVGSTLVNANLEDPKDLDRLKSDLSAFINETGVNGGVLQVAERERLFVEKGDLASLRALVELLPNLPPELASGILYRLGNTLLSKLEDDALSQELFSEALELSATYPEIAGTFGAAANRYMATHFLSLEGKALDDFALSLGMSAESYDAFYAEMQKEGNRRRKAKRFAILLQATFYCGNVLEPSTVASRYLALMRGVDIASCYGVLSFEERQNGEEIYFGLPEDGKFNDAEIDLLAFLAYSAYRPNSNLEWKKIRLKGLELRLRPLETEEKIHTLAKIREAMERFESVLYAQGYTLEGLEKFYFDVYGEFLRQEFRKVDYKILMSLYAQYSSSTYLALNAALVEALCDLSAFLAAYPNLTGSDVNSFLPLFRSMPSTKEVLVMVRYLEDYGRTSRLNDSMAEFRLGFLRRCYGLLSPKDRENLPPFPDDEDTLQSKIVFAEHLDTIFDRYAGETELGRNFRLPSKAAEAEPSHVEAKKETRQSKTLVYATLTYSANASKPFEVKIELEADQAFALPSFSVIASRKDPEVDEHDYAVRQWAGIELKRSLFQRTPHAKIEFDCPPIPFQQQLFLKFDDPDVPLAFRVTRTKK